MISVNKWTQYVRKDIMPYERKITVALFTAVLFHFFGLIGMLSSHKAWFVASTPFTLGLMTLLLIWTEYKKDITFYWFMMLSFFVGMIAEIIGVNTMLLFGDYNYGIMMGPKYLGVPYLIGVQWFMTVYCIGHLTLWITQNVFQNRKNNIITSFFNICLAALITTMYDIILEPAAIQLEYWQWLPNGEVPLFNYLCWFFISGLLYCPFFMTDRLTSKFNYFAIWLICIQSIFFLVIGYMGFK